MPFNISSGLSNAGTFATTGALVGGIPGALVGGALGFLSGLLSTDSPREKEAARNQLLLNDLYRRAGQYNRIDPTRVNQLNQYSNSAYNDAMSKGLAYLGQYGNIANNNLYAQEQRQAQLAGQGAVQQGYALGLTNPYAMKERALSNTYDRFADQFGNLNTSLAGQNAQLQTSLSSQLAEAMNRNPQIAYQMLQDVYRNKLAALSAQAGNTQNYGNLDDFSRWVETLGTAAQAYKAIKG